MNKVFSVPDAYDIISCTISERRLKPGTWGDGVETVCFMSALVSGAGSTYDCLTKGWPGWLTGEIVKLFDDQTSRNTAADQNDRHEWALQLAAAVQKPFDHDDARKRYVESLLLDQTHGVYKAFMENGGVTGNMFVLADEFLRYRKGKVTKVDFCRGFVDDLRDKINEWLGSLAGIHSDDPYVLNNSPSSCYNHLMAWVALQGAPRRVGFKNAAILRELLLKAIRDAHVDQ